MHSVNGHRRNNNFREEPAKSSVQVQSVRASSQRLAFLVTSVSSPHPHPPHDSQASSAHYSVQQIQRAGTLLVKHLPKAGRGASSAGARRFCLRSPVPALDDSKTALNIHPDRPGLSPASPVTRAHAHPNKQLPLRPPPPPVSHERFNPGMSGSSLLLPGELRQWRVFLFCLAAFFFFFFKAPHLKN